MGACRASYIKRMFCRVYVEVLTLMILDVDYVDYVAIWLHASSMSIGILRMTAKVTECVRAARPDDVTYI